MTPVRSAGRVKSPRLRTGAVSPRARARFAVPMQGDHVAFGELAANGERITQALLEASQVEHDAETMP